MSWIYADHEKEDHVVSGSPHDQMRAIMARHLCGWISGHGGPIDHFLVDADLIMEEAHDHGIRYHLDAGTEEMTT